MEVKLKTDQSSPNPDDAAIMAARGDYMSDSLVDASVEEAMEGTEKSKEELIKELLRRGHFGPFEHNVAYFAIEGISRVTMAQITRHRHMSFDVQSMRYVDFDDADVVVPESIQEKEGREYAYDYSIDRAFRRYEELVEDGVPEEDARFVLPLGTKINMSMSGNARTLMHVFDLRHSGKAQWEVRELAEHMIEECKEWAPLTFQAYEEHIKNNSLRAP